MIEVVTGERRRIFKYWIVGLFIFQDYISKIPWYLINNQCMCVKSLLVLIEFYRWKLCVIWLFYDILLELISCFISSTLKLAKINGIIYSFNRNILIMCLLKFVSFHTLALNFTCTIELFKITSSFIGSCFHNKFLR